MFLFSWPEWAESWATEKRKSEGEGTRQWQGFLCSSCDPPPFFILCSVLSFKINLKEISITVKSVSGLECKPYLYLFHTPKLTTPVPNIDLSPKNSEEQC